MGNQTQMITENVEDVNVITEPQEFIPEGMVKVRGKIVPKLKSFNPQEPISSSNPIEIPIVNGKLRLRDVIKQTANGDASIVDGKKLVLNGQFTTGRRKSADIVKASWLPKELDPFCKDPENIPVPNTIPRVTLIKPLDVEMLTGGSVKGEPMIAFRSHLEQQIGEDSKRLFLLSFTLVDANNVPNNALPGSQRITDMLNNL